MTQWSAQIAGLYTGQERMEGCRSELHSIRDELRRIDNKIRRQCPSLANSSVRARADSLEICAGDCADLGTTLGRIADRCRDVENSLSGYRDSGAQAPDAGGGASDSRPAAEATQDTDDSSSNFWDWIVENKSVIIKIISQFGSIGTLLAALMTEGSANSMKDIAKTVKYFIKSLEKVAKVNESGVDASWADYLGLTDLTKTGSATNVAKAASDTAKAASDTAKASSVLKGTGYVVSVITEFFDNLDEYHEGGMSKGRLVAETAIEGAFSIGTSVATATLIALFGLTGPGAIAFGVGSVVALWALDKGCEAIYGKKADEVLSDFICDTGEKIIDAAKGAGEKIKNAVQTAKDGVTTAWNTITGWFSPQPAAVGGGGSW